MGYTYKELDMTEVTKHACISFVRISFKRLRDDRPDGSPVGRDLRSSAITTPALVRH